MVNTNTDGSRITNETEYGTCAIHGNCKKFVLDYYCKVCNDTFDVRASAENGFPAPENNIDETSEEETVPKTQEILNHEKFQATGIQGEGAPGGVVDQLLDKMLPRTDFQPPWARTEFRNRESSWDIKNQSEMLRRLTSDETTPDYPVQSKSACSC